LIEKERALLIPHFDEMAQIAMKTGAFNLSISGSGPTVFSFANSLEILLFVSVAINDLLSQKGISCQTYRFLLNNEGSYVQLQEE